MRYQLAQVVAAFRGVATEQVRILCFLRATGASERVIRYRKPTLASDAFQETHAGADLVR